MKQMDKMKTATLSQMKERMAVMIRVMELPMTLVS